MKKDKKLIIIVLVILIIISLTFPSFIDLVSVKSKKVSLCKILPNLFYVRDNCFLNYAIKNKEIVGCNQLGKIEDIPHNERSSFTSLYRLMKGLVWETCVMRVAFEYKDPNFCKEHNFTHNDCEPCSKQARWEDCW